MADARTLLLIADIGGYTKFMNYHRFSLAHAQDAVARLLETLIDAAEPAFKVAKLEGDAVFFYSELPDVSEASLTKLAQRVRAMRHQFGMKQKLMDINRLCICDACTQVGDLKLKFVSHLGEVAFQRVKKYHELAGMDVIIVHRLLKNSVPVPEYVLMTEPVVENLAADLRGQVVAHQEDLEGVGNTKLAYLDLQEIAKLELPSLQPSWWHKIIGLAGLNVRTWPYLLGLRKPCVDFQNLESAPSQGLLPPAQPTGSA
jgi:hypothetical protein